ncbi:aldehyde reductase [Mitsuaria sp. 7]|uniref:SDR family oxidoreductase n=1 Tax=Mitsuaria sp. 7 TaxID=1658665 RepID=UPI0007DD59C9|nr:aldehyde reductase [Mitsuaria sp. 7]ANH66934.1 epimerase [Mitsuaria sp. 7]
MSSKPILVTGGSGFIAGHCLLQLLAQGHAVRATLRSLSQEDAVRTALKQSGLTHGERLTFVAADLTSDAGWPQAVEGVDVVLHVASPVQPGHVADENALIRPAREGTLRVLRAARDAGVKRVVLTSAFHAMSWGWPHGDHTFTEDDWTVLDGPGVDAYGRSKTLAERAAWDFIGTQGRGMELVTMLPVAVMGPVMGRNISGSNHLVQRLLEGGMPGLPNLFIPVVDVRDVATAHLLAMTAPEAAGQRFLLSNGQALGMNEIAAILKTALGEAARRVPTRRIPDLVLRVMALFRAELRSIVHDLGHAKRTSNARAAALLGWQPRPADEAIIAAGRSMVAGGILKR